MNAAVNNDLARGRWGMGDGIIVSDCGAVGDAMSTRYIKARFGGTPEAQAAQAVKGGCDYNCGPFYAAHLHGALAKGELDPSDDIDKSAFRLLKAMFRLGLFDRVETVPYASYGRDQLDTEASRQIALDGATQSIVLLQNNNSGSGGGGGGGSKRKRPLLPLAAATRVALIGPHFNASDDMLSNYKGSNNVVYAHTPLLAISKRGNVVAAAKGCGLWNSDESGFAAASAAAKKADVAVVFLGLHPQWFDNPGDGDAAEGEDNDRQNITLPAVQLKLLQAVHRTGTQVVVVMINGGQVAIPWAKANVPAIVEVRTLRTVRTVCGTCATRLVVGRRGPTRLMHAACRMPHGACPVHRGLRLAGCCR